MSLLNALATSRDRPNHRQAPVRVVVAVVLASAVACFGLAHPVRAQDASRADTTAGPDKVGYVAFGSQYLTGIGSLNDALGEAGYSTTERTTLSLGVGGYRVVGDRTMLGFEGQGLVGFEDTSGSRDAPIGAAYGFGNVGYQIVSTDRFRFYPLVGFGLGASFVNFEPNENKPEQSFDDVLDDPDRRSLVAQGALLVQGGLGVEYRVPFDLRGPMTRRLDRVVIGLRTGYVLDPATTDWSLSNGEDLESGPDAAPSGPYLRLIVGGL
jgi:hypothetical protein